MLIRPLSLKVRVTLANPYAFVGQRRICKPLTPLVVRYERATALIRQLIRHVVTPGYSLIMLAANDKNDHRSFLNAGDNKQNAPQQFSVLVNQTSTYTHTHTRLAAPDELATYCAISASVNCL